MGRKEPSFIKDEALSSIANSETGEREEVLKTTLGKEDYKESSSSRIPTDSLMSQQLERDEHLAEISRSHFKHKASIP